MVCYDNITVETLPAIDEFVQDCGFCRTCFTATPESSESESMAVATCTCMLRVLCGFPLLGSKG